MTTSLPPTQADWGILPKDDLDAQAAYQDFYGKTNQDMQPYFCNNVIEGADSLRWMPAIPFRYYMQGFIDHVISRGPDDFDAPDAASCFLNLVEERLKNVPEIITPIMPKIILVVDHLASNPLAYSADKAIYGDFGEAKHKITTLWKQRR